MDIQTLQKLSKNPHYKLSPAQREQLSQVERKPMVEFGSPNIHVNEFNRHDVEQTFNRKTKKGK
jgi:hypothetical protein